MSPPSSRTVSSLLVVLLLVVCLFPAEHGIDFANTKPLTSTNQLQTHTENFAGDARKLLVNMNNEVRSGTRTDRIGTPVHIVVFWPSLGEKRRRSVLEELQATEGLRVLLVQSFAFPKDQKKWAECHAKFYGRNHWGAVKKHWADPKIVYAEKGMGQVYAAVVALDSTMERWKEIPGTEGSHDSAMGKLKVYLRDKYKIRFALHTSDDEREARVDIPSFFGKRAYEQMAHYTGEGWDGTTIGKGPGGCPVPGPVPKMYGDKKMKKIKMTNLKAYQTTQGG